jgi:hypothetical protein
MELKVFSVGELGRSVTGTWLWNGEVHAISEHRARAQANNPRASATDPALIVAIEDGRVIGYQGILPDYFYIAGTAHKMGWLTTWWVDPTKIHSGAGALLLFRALKLYDRRIGVREMSEDARAAFERHRGMVFLQDDIGLTLLLRANTHEVLPRRLPWTRQLLYLLKSLDAAANILIGARLRRWQTQRPIGDGVSVHQVEQIDEETGRFIERWNRSELTRRGRAELNWMINHPWIVTDSSGGRSADQYYFSSVARRFSFLCIQVRDPQRCLVGFMILRARDGQVAVPYIYFDPTHTAVMMRVILHQTINLNANRLTLFHPGLLSALRDLDFPALYRARKIRSCAVSDRFRHLGLRSAILQDGDGDCAFT